jgi:hypothetical protein
MGCGTSRRAVRVPTASHPGARIAGRKRRKLGRRTSVSMRKASTRVEICIIAARVGV